MSFLSYSFFAFLLILIIVYYLCGTRLRWGVLLVGSVLFYLPAGIDKLAFVLVTSLVVYGAGLQMGRIYASADEQQLEGRERAAVLLSLKKRCRRYLIPALILVIGALVYCKFVRMLFSALDGLFQNGISFEVIIPLGISYYTFASVGYLLDIYWRKQQPIKNYFKYLLCMIYFPQIVQGPIPKYRKLYPEIFREHRWDFKQVCFGAQLMIYGYFKKLVLADRLAIFTDNVFGSLEDYEGLVIVIALIFSAFQLYMDFSGCMDIVRGASQIFGIELESNFNHPFFSKSAAEFWRRWHITLGAWFKDYVYMPVVTSGWLTRLTTSVKDRFGKDIAKRINSAIPLAIVWLLTGLWHGTGANYILWGVYWGAFIIFSTIFSKQYKAIADKLHINTASPDYRQFQMVRTFCIFIISRLIVAPGTLEKSGVAIRQLFSCFNPWIFWDGSLYQMGLDYKDLCVIILGLLLVYKISWLQERGSVREMIAAKPIVLRWLIYYAAFFAVIIFGVYGSQYDASKFVYANF